MAPSGDLLPGEREEPLAPAADLAPGETEEPIKSTGAAMSQTMSPEQFQRQIEGQQAAGGLGMPVVTSPDVAEPVLRYGVPAAASAAALAAAPFEVLPQAAAGAGTSVISDAWNRLMDKAFGREGEPLTATNIGRSAAIGAITGAAAPALEAGAGLRGARKMVGASQEEATEQAQKLATHQAEIRSDVAGRQTEANAKAQAAGQKLQQRQEAIRQDIATKRQNLAQSTAADHERAVADIQEKLAKNRRDLSQAHANAIENARPEIAQRAATRQAAKMVGKTSAELQAQEAQPYEQRSSALAYTKDPYFDAALKFHQEVGQKFEPYIGKVKDNPIPADTMDSVRQEVGGIGDTIAQRGLRIQSSELNKMLGDLGGAPAAVAPNGPSIDLGTSSSEFLRKQGISESVGDTAHAQMVLQDHGWSLGDIRKLPKGQLTIEAQKILNQNASAAGGRTYGQLWGYRSRANRILASSKNPADRWAADQLVTKLTDVLPNVPPEVRQQYAFERGLMRDVTREVAGARTPREVGDALFNSGTAEAPLQVIRFTKRFAPEKLGGIKEAFADWFIGKGGNPDQLAKLNPAVVRELYGKEADPILRLLGPEGSAKERSVEQLISASPETRQEFDDVWNTEMTRHENISRRQAISQGEQALRQLGSKYDSVKRALANAKTPEAKLQVLRQALPQPEQVQPTKAEAKVLAQRPTTPHEAARKTLESGIPPARMERYAQHRMAFDSLIALTSGAGVIAKHPYVGAGIGAGLGLRLGVRWALTTPRGAELYLRLLESSKPALIAKGLAGMAASVATSTAREQFTPTSSDTPDPTAAASR